MLYLLTQRASARVRGLPHEVTWVMFYGVEAAAGALSHYNVIVLDPAFQGSVEECAALGAQTFAYVSVGEFSCMRTVVSSSIDSAVLLDENPNWPGTYRIDVRHPTWQSYILDDVVPRLFARGFVGLFLDTLDTPPHLEEIDPSRYRGMRSAAIALVRSLRLRYPDAPIIVNRGYALLPALVDAIDGIVAESFITTYDFLTQSYMWVEPTLVARQTELLRPARERRPPLPVLSLDYWDPREPETIRNIYDIERERGHSPYVATILLDRIVAEPRT